jgi:hypothetical protein
MVNIKNILSSFFAPEKEPEQSGKVDIDVRTGYGIKMPDADVEMERQKKEDIINLLELFIRASGYFRKEKIPELIATIRKGSVPYGRTSTEIVFEGDTFLTIEEKRALGLNVRMKYSRKFIDYFNPSKLREIGEPRSMLESLHLDAFHRTINKYDLIKLKKLGFVKKVKIVPCGDGFDCKRIRRCKKIYNIGEVPQLPLPECDAPYCRCYYEPIISNRD